ncbi:glycosyl hydrolase family 28-related protein [Chania multitudinisentens]|uniref:glycosyl hydrolase family 28-related protein n=1 Tax=Chania multitudinisentens TaxID=1639108 RepID=UPI00138AB300|nr:glycosyl hydrolase family 28-related protein [Chania multitudinisentens]
MSNIKSEDIFQEVANDVNSINYRSYTISGRFDEEVSVKAFGAKGDGVTDDSVNIQRAIDFVTAKGGVLIFPTGVYRIATTLNIITSIKMKGTGLTFYDKASKLVCGSPNMTLFNLGGPENYIENMVIQGYETDLSDIVNGYGQAGTCIGFRFARANGSKDIDSYITGCSAAGFLKGVEAIGSNLKVTDTLFTACRFSLDFYAAATAPADFRGFIVDNTRFHKCGGNGYTNDAICIRTTGIFKNSQLTNLFADVGTNMLYYGALAEGACIRGVISRYATGDLITVVNSGITPSAAYQHYQITDVSFQTPTGATATAGGWAIKLYDAPGGNISGVSTTFTRKGLISAVNSSDLMLSGLFARNINVDYFSSGLDCDAIELINSVDVQIDNVFVRNTLNSNQTRSVINLDATSSCNIRQISYVNVTNISIGEGSITGECYNARSAPSMTYGTVVPTKGFYRAGSIHINTSATSGGPGMWICTTAGSPGIWKAFVLGS